MKFPIALLASAGLLAMALPALAQPAANKTANPRCFHSNQIDNWKAADAKTIYLRIIGGRIYRLDLGGTCHTITRPGAFLVTKLRGSSFICRAIDWDLRATTSWRDVPEHCIVKSMTELTPEEAAALPRKVRP